MDAVVKASPGYRRTQKRGYLFYPKKSASLELGCVCFLFVF